MSLVKNIKDLCNGKNTTLAALERELDFGQGTIRKWENSSPSVDKLQKISEYFNVPVDSLLGDGQKEKPTLTKKGEPDITFDDFTYALHNEANELTEENKQKLLEMAKLFKLSQEQDKK